MKLHTDSELTEKTKADFASDYPALLDRARATIDELYRELYETPIDPETLVSAPANPPEDGD
jgi:hypothetical protein